MKVIVVGGGPGGMMAAITAARNGHRVTLLERNMELGKKLLLTGNGRCNITNSCDGYEFFSHIFRNQKFFYSPFLAFSSGDFLSFMEAEGLRTKIEDKGRVFPIGDRAADVRDKLEEILEKDNVEVIRGFTVRELIIEDGVCLGVKGLFGEAKGEKSFLGDVVILATGGMSFPKTGSDGKGFSMARDAGHRVITPKPGLTPLILDESWWKELQGLSIKDASLTLGGRKKGKTVFGDIIFTHFGLSGPCALRAGSMMNEFPDPNVIYLDCIPHISEEEVGEKIREKADNSGKTHISTILQEFCPKAYAKTILEQEGIPLNRRASEVSRGEREKIIQRMKKLPLMIRAAAGFDRAMITIGGIDVREVKPGTMESKIVRNLRFAGEILDLDGDTGGFNLQIAWSTGRRAGTI